MIDQLLKIPGATRERLQRLADGRFTQLDELWACPWKLLPTPDPWQKRVLADPLHDWILCASRQSGKTEVVSAQVVWEAQCCGSFVLIISASEAQAFEFMERVYQRYDDMPLVPMLDSRTKSEMRLVNGARILALPNNERTVRVYSSVDRLIIDEASRVPDSLYGAVCPMLAVANGRQTLLSTPFGKRGFFYQEWSEGTTWQRAKIPWTLCPRIKPEFIVNERRKHGDLWVQQEYECTFLDVACGIFNVAAFQELVDTTMELVPW